MAKLKMIPRKTLRGKRVSLSYDEYNLPTTTDSNYFTLENASFQPADGKKQMAGLDGYRDKTVYLVFTDTELKTATDGDVSSHADKVELYPNRWFTVIKVARWDSGVIPHYEAIVVDLPER